MELSKKQKEFIVSANTHTDVCMDWRRKIRGMFPELFPNHEWKPGDFLTLTKDYSYLKKGDTYPFKSWQNSVGGCVTLDHRCCSENPGEYSSPFNDGLRLATEEEKGSYFSREAARRGYKEGVTIIAAKYGGERTLENGPNKTCHFKGEDYVTMFGWCIYSQGEWAEILPPKKSITKADAEEKLGLKIICDGD